jgi:hypothetical protein
LEIQSIVGILAPLKEIFKNKQIKIAGIPENSGKIEKTVNYLKN